MAAPGANEMVVVVTGGDPIDPAQVRALPPFAHVIAADAGVEQAQALGLAIDLAVGDFDSVRPDALARVEAAGTVVERHPTAKDATDLELALDAAAALDPARIHVLGGHGGRLDHLIANAMLLASPAYAAFQVTAEMGRARVTIVRTLAEVTGPIGDMVSLVPVHGVARGVTTRGLAFPLDAEDLHSGSTRGISNELVRSNASIRVEQGVLMAIQPGSLGPHHQELLP
jgi:thiamine pyrophosphokinase